MGVALQDREFVTIATGISEEFSEQANLPKKKRHVVSRLSEMHRLISDAVV